MQDRSTAQTRGPETLHQAQNRERLAREGVRTPPSPPGDSVLSFPCDVWVMSKKALDPGDGAPIPANEFVRVRDNLRLLRLRAHARMESADFYEAPHGATPISKRPFKFESEDASKE